jgi:maltose/moltooligosaccharide transporter
MEIRNGDGEDNAPKPYRAGTLTYTRAGLAMLFFWLLWGDFCYVVTESVMPTIMPLKFKALGASNTVTAMILITMPWMVGLVFNPIVSFKSDRFRSRWGRRIPFILGTLPFIVMGLILVGHAEGISYWLHSRLGSYVAHLSPNTMAIITIGALTVAFSFFNTFLSSVFWYLFNDVVPEHLLARFMSWFRLISMFSAAGYQFFILRFADTHSTEIFEGAAVLYFFGFGAMCLNVKEGEYPPPPPYIDGQSGILGAIKTYATECHFTPYYWYQWMSTFLGTIGSSGGAIGSGAAAGSTLTFAELFYQAVGLNVGQIGDINGTTLVATGALILYSGWLADKYHPFRVVLVGAVLGTFVTTPLNFVWLFWHPSQNVAFWFCIATGIGLAAPVAALNGVYDPPLFMRIFPRERYGQFCSANSIWRALGAIIGGILTGYFLDLITPLVGKDRAYYYIPVWQLIWGVPGFYCLVKLFLGWKRYGGDKSYVPPMPTPRNPVMPGAPTASL